MGLYHQGSERYRRYFVLTLFAGDNQCSRIRILCFFQISKKHDFLRFFEMTYQKVVKSR